MPDIGAKVQHRIKGRDALTRSLRLLLVRVHRYGRHRAATDTDRMWAARLIDQLVAAVETADPRPRP